MKNTKRFYAYIKKKDLLNGEIIVYDKDTKQKTKYNTAGELFDDGWVVDMKRNRELRVLNTDETKTGKRNKFLKLKSL